MSKSANPNQKAATAREALEARGLRVTGPRVSVLIALREMSGPVSHAELADKLADATIDRATVYRNLLALTEVGLVRRTDLGDHTWRFELADANHDAAAHPHFVCTDCGTVTCMPEGSVSIVSKGAPPELPRRRAVEVQLKGVCARCA
jgi:Fur family ferric uptake transcriptional regulator